MLVLPRSVAAPQLDADRRRRNLDLSISRLIHPREKEMSSTPAPTAQRQLLSAPSPPRPMASSLERLPNEVKSMIFQQLDYQTLIQLSTVSRGLHETVDPAALASPADKAEFVMRAAKDFPQHRPSEKGQDYRPGNFECYMCYRVRAPDHFDIYQATSVFVDNRGMAVRGREPRPGLDREVMLRRFCIECGVKHGLHAPPDLMTTKTGRDLWVCLCRVVWEKPGCMRCPDCAADCPLGPKRKLYGTKS